MVENSAKPQVKIVENVDNSYLRRSKAWLKVELETCIDLVHMPV